MTESPSSEASNATDGGDATPQPRARGTYWLRLGWPLFIALMLLLGLYEGLNDLIDLRRASSSTATWKPFALQLTSVLVILALIPIVVRVELRYRLDSKPRSRVIVAHTIAAIVFSTVHSVGMTELRKIVYALAGESFAVGGPLSALVGWFYELQKDLITYVVILLVVFAAREFRQRRAGELRALKLVAELSDARLRHLTAQVDPHFLFNALNAISNRMREDVDAADRMISQLGDLLRAAYTTDQQLLIPLGNEIVWLRGYAAMMAERFRGQLQFELDVQPDLEAIKVPRLLLQPIVENAFRHGLAGGRGNLWVGVRRSGPRLICTVADDGVGLPQAPMNRGTGLSNVSRRLQLLFPDDHEISFAPREPRGTIVTVAFPVS
jgi:signal transduction histidine kinase